MVSELNPGDLVFYTGATVPKLTVCVESKTDKSRRALAPSFLVSHNFQFLHGVEPVVTFLQGKRVWQTQER